MVLEQALIAGSQTPEAVQPGDRPFDHPALPAKPERARGFRRSPRLTSPAGPRRSGAGAARGVVPARSRPAPTAAGAGERSLANSRAPVARPTNLAGRIGQDTNPHSRPRSSSTSSGSTSSRTSSRRVAAPVWREDEAGHRTTARVDRELDRVAFELLDDHTRHCVVGRDRGEPRRH